MATETAPWRELLDPRRTRRNSRRKASTRPRFGSGLVGLLLEHTFTVFSGQGFGVLPLKTEGRLTRRSLGPERLRSPETRSWPSSAHPDGRSSPISRSRTQRRRTARWRLYFKPQAVYYVEAVGGRFNAGDARSTWIEDIRRLDGPGFLKEVAHTLRA